VAPSGPHTLRERKARIGMALTTPVIEHSVSVEELENACNQRNQMIRHRLRKGDIAGIRFMGIWMIPEVEAERVKARFPRKEEK